MRSLLFIISAFCLLVYQIKGQNAVKNSYWVVDVQGGPGYIPQMNQYRTDGYQYNFWWDNNPEYPFTTTKLSTVTQLGGSFSYGLQKVGPDDNSKFFEIGLGVQFFNYDVNYFQPDVSTAGHFSTRYNYDYNKFNYTINRLNLGLVVTNGTMFSKGLYMAHSAGIFYQTHILKKEYSNPVKIEDNGAPWPGTSYQIYTNENNTIKNYCKDDVSCYDNLQIGYSLKKITPHVYFQVNSYNFSKSFLTNVLFSFGLGCKVVL